MDSMLVLPDIDLISNPNLELFIIENAADIKRISDSLNVKGRICKKAIAICLGVYHDSRKKNALYYRLNQLKCIGKVNNGYMLKVDSANFLDDSDVINSDPVLSIMNKIITGERGMLGSVPPIDFQAIEELDNQPSGDEELIECAAGLVVQQV